MAFAAILFFSSFNIAPSSATGFPDVKDSNRFHKEIQYLLGEGVIAGFKDGHFRPKENVTRGQAAIMIGKALGYSAEVQNTQFKDVDDTSCQAAILRNL